MPSDQTARSKRASTPVSPAQKTLDENWMDWENHAFGFGYGDGEYHIIPALKHFMLLCPADGPYDFRVLEGDLTPAVAWLLINRLCHHSVDLLAYGTSPRHAWLTRRGKALKEYMDSRTASELVDIVCSHDEDYTACYPDACNCGPNGYQKGKLCPNPFWDKDPWRVYREEITNAD